MQTNDKVCRVAVFPRFLKDGIFKDDQLLNFESLDKKKNVYALSVVSKWLLRTDEAVHEFGESVAKAGNTRLQINNNGTIPENRQQFYLAFYHMMYGDVVRLEMKFYSLKVKWCPENNCEAHFQIEMWQSSSIGTKGERRRDRTLAIKELSKSLKGPKKPIVNARDKRINLFPKLQDRPTYLTA